MANPSGNFQNGEDSYSICRFMPPKSKGAPMEPVVFVYETEIHKLRQPLLSRLFCFHIVIDGEGELQMGERYYSLSRGVGFFAFPQSKYYIKDYNNLKYAYISYSGTEAGNMLSAYGINEENPVVHGLECVCDHFIDTICRVNQTNATLLTESALLYALSFVAEKRTAEQPLDRGDKLYNQILGYITVNFSDPGISLSKIGDVFSYSEKYISTLIKKNMGEGFSHYLNRLRIDRAKKLMRTGKVSIAEISETCGFRDPLYFSKVFKKYAGLSPTEYLKQLDGELVQ